MLHLSVASRARPLALALAEMMAEPLADPMTPEWVAVPTAAMGRWLALELARSLGSSGPDAGDGVAANIEFSFPGALRNLVLEAGRGGVCDPWQVDSLVWAVLEVLGDRAGDERLSPVTVLPDGATWFGRARRLADLFDRYAVRRPDLLLHWRAGHDIDAAGRALVADELWQPHLWRLVRARIGFPSPPERIGGLLDEVRSGALALELPPRLSVFGVTTLPNGAAFIELVEAVASHHDVLLMLLDPSPATSSLVRKAVVSRRLPLFLLRSEDPTDSEVRVVRHPLLGSWGRPYRERSLLLAAAESHGLPAPELVGQDPGTGDPPSLLTRLQRDLRSDSAPAGDFELDDTDRSVQVHSCHGQARQVQVLRDVILQLLAHDPTLTEEDIVIVSPAIDQFAPLVEAGFGTPARSGTEGLFPSGVHAPTNSPPALRYRVTDRSLRESYPVFAALDSLLGLIAGRFSSTEVLEFISLPTVRRRFELDEQALGTIADWVERAKVRWGIDGAHRAAWGLPAQFSANSWGAAIDRILMGVAVSEDGIELAPGGIAPLGVEGSDITLAGRLAEIVARLSTLAEEATLPRPVADWCEVLSQAIGQFFDVEETQRFQLDQLRRILAEVADGALVGDKPAGFELSLGDVRRLLADRLRGAPARTDFFRGGITVSSLTPLRWLPFRVVCLLGLDDAGTTGTGVADGDDLAALAPLVGDHDQRSEIRQALLEAVLAACDHLVITRLGRSVRTNREVPYTTVLAELRDTITATLSPKCRALYWGRIETVHPCQSFDEANFTKGALCGSGPFSFDPGALGGAVARRNQNEQVNLIAGPLPEGEREPVVTLSELKGFLRNPVKTFLRQRLKMRLLSEEGELSDEFATSLDALEHWAVGERLLAARLEGHSASAWRLRELALGALPPGVLGDIALSEIETNVEGLLERAGELGVEPALEERLAVEVTLGDGTRIVDTIAGRCPGPRRGPALVTCSRIGPRRRVPAWLDLVALVATDPGTEWRSVVVGGAETGGGLAAVELVARGESADDRRRRALEGLEVAVDCYRRGLREPIPLFPVLSYKIRRGRAVQDDWQGYRGGGDGNDEANRFVFGDISLRELRQLPARADDPRGSRSGRVERFADYLWNAIEQSAEEAG